MTVCPSCGHVTDGAKFCPECGTALAVAPAREERKVVTVLFADLVGFTARAETMDPEDVRALLAPYHARLRAELERFGGTVEKFIGDAVMALFGAPAAHEDDPERAVRAALAIRDWVREDGQLQVRIAVNTGEALIALGARPEAGEGMASGDVVNTTARMQSAAPVNGVLVGEATYRATHHVIEYDRRDPVDAKGKGEPIVVWEAVQARSRFGVDVVQQSRAPLVGRERELAALREALARARQEPSVQLVTLVGVPGIGKSRLVYELMQSIRDEPSDELITWRQGRSLPYGEGVSLWALGEMVKAQAGVLESDSPEAARAKLEESVAAVVSAEDAPWVEHHVRALLGIGEQDTSDRDEAFAAWRRYLEGLAEQRPLVLVFEDLHWADDALLDFVHHLVDWATGVPMLVIATARPELFEKRPGWGGGMRNASTLSLSPLGSVETSELIRALTGRSLLAADTQGALLERAEGNPLYAEQFVRMLEEQRIDAGALPETVQGIIAARLDGLPPEEKALLLDAAIMGKVFWVGAVEAIGAIDRRHAEALLHSLDRKDFVRRERRPSIQGEVEYAFRHILVRDVAYSHLPRSARVEKHRRAAEWIESLGRPKDHAEMLAHHYLSAVEFARAAGLPVEAFTDRARGAAIAAGDRAASLNAADAAYRFYTAALELSPDDTPERARVLLAAARALYHSEDAPEEELIEARDALVKHGDTDGAAEAELMLADIIWRRGRRDEAFDHRDAAVQLVSGSAASEVKARVLANTARYHALAAEPEPALRIGRGALAMADELNLDELRASVLNTIGIARVYEGDWGGLGDIERAIAVAEAINSREAVRGYINLSVFSDDNGDPRRAWEARATAQRMAERFGSVQDIRWLEAGRTLEAYFEGDWDDALRRSTDFILACANSPHYHESAQRVIRAMIRVARDDVTSAVEDADRAVALAHEAKDPQALCTTLASAAFAFERAGRADRAQSVAHELLGLMSEGIWGLLRPFVEFTFAAVKLSLDSELKALLRQPPRTSPWLDAARAILGGNALAAAEMFEATGSRPYEGLARLQAAETLAAEGDRSTADQQLRRALAFFREVRATRYIREGESLLAAAS